MEETEQNGHNNNDELKKKLTDESILRAKGMYDYFQNIDEKILNKRVCMGNSTNII